MQQHVHGGQNRMLIALAQLTLEELASSESELLLEKAFYSIM